MSNWWKRFFGLEEDEAEESRFPTIEPIRGDGRRNSPGRFEDPNRQIDVKVLHHYPEQGSYQQRNSSTQVPLYPRTERARTFRGSEEARSKRNEWDDLPAYLRRSMREDVQPRFEKKERRTEEREKRQEEKTSVSSAKRARFSPTTVASPVYGYRERPAPREKNSPIEQNSFKNERERVRDVHGISIERPAFERPSHNRWESQVEERRPARQQGEWKPVLTNTLSTYDKIKATVIEERQKRLNQNTTYLESEEENVTSQTAPDLKLTEAYVNLSPSRKESEHIQSEIIDEIINETHLTHERGVELEELEELKEHEELKGLEEHEEQVSPYPLVNESDVIRDDKPAVEMIEETENHKESDHDDVSSMSRSISTDNADLAPSNDQNRVKEPPRKSAIPYNVMMTRSDRVALRTHEKPTERSAQRPPGSLSPKPVENPPVQRLSLGLLEQAPQTVSEDDLDWIEQKKAELSESLDNFNVKADVLSHVQGPTVTRFEIRLHPGVKVSKVIGLTEDLKLTLSAKQIRIAPVPGKNTVGIEIPNQKRKPVFLKSLLQSEAYQEAKSPLTAVLGQDITGQQVVTDLAKMPHGLIAGATGSGKSVCIHSLILSLIYKASPEDLRLILIDPKVVELATYREMPHLAAPVITQPREAALALKWAVNEMERRYQLFADMGVRDLSRYNDLVKEGKAQGQTIPYIVIIIDELADLMMTSPQDVEAAICRIAQKARAAGIHMLLATQRPSVDVITGLIKSNIPTRIAFGVSSQADSRTILDMSGAERLLGQGDMLFSENGSRSLRRLQGTFVTDEEIERITDTFHQLEGPEYLFDVSDLQEKQAWDDEEDELFEEAGYFVIEQGQASVSSLQRRFRIGYNRAARLVDQLEAAQIISEANGSKPRQVLVDKGTFEQAYFNGEKTQV